MENGKPDKLSSQPIDTTNRQFVSVTITGDRVHVMAPLTTMTPEEALVHAAWLVVLARGQARFTFEHALNAVECQ